MFNSTYADQYKARGGAYPGLNFLQLFLHTDLSGVLRALMSKKTCLDFNDEVAEVTEHVMNGEGMTPELRDLFRNMPPDLSTITAAKMFAMFVKMDTERWVDTADLA